MPEPYIEVAFTAIGLHFVWNKLTHQCQLTVSVSVLQPQAELE